MPRISSTGREPRTKGEFIDRMLSFDFSGDIRSLFNHNCVLTRVGSNSLAVTSMATGKRWVLRVSLPRKEAEETVPATAGIGAQKGATHQAPASVQSGRETSSAPQRKRQKKGRNKR